MYKIIKNYFNHKDERGEIKGLVNFGSWEEINYITSIEGTVRGGHYHKNTKELLRCNLNNAARATQPPLA